MRALTRRDRRPLTPERLEVGHLAIDVPRTAGLSARRARLSLTSREYALLEYLARRAGDVVGRADIAEHVWDEHYDAFSNVVDVYVQRLRRKLDDPTRPRSSAPAAARDISCCRAVTLSLRIAADALVFGAALLTVVALQRHRPLAALAPRC